MKDSIKMKTVFSIVLVIVIAISLTFGVKVTAGPENHKHAVVQIDQKIKTVLELTASSATVSTLISACPGDLATPVADKIADLSSYFLIALCTLYLEKYLVSLVGYAAFGLLIPLACLFGLLYMWLTYFWKREEIIKIIAYKIAVFAVAIYFIIPISVKISDIVYDTYSETIQMTIDDAKMAADSITSEDTSDSVLEKISDWVSDTASDLKEKITGVLNKYIEALAIMLVTCCIIPIVILLSMVWLTQLIFQVNIPIQPAFGKFMDDRRRMNHTFNQAIHDNAERSRAEKHKKAIEDTEDEDDDLDEELSKIELKNFLKHKDDE